MYQCIHLLSEATHKACIHLFTFALLPGQCQLLSMRHCPGCLVGVVRCLYQTLASGVGSSSAILKRQYNCSEIY